jgi:hypothetical protein
LHGVAEHHRVTGRDEPFRTVHRIVLMLAELQPYLEESDDLAVTEYARTRPPVLFSSARTRS